MGGDDGAELSAPERIHRLRPSPTKREIRSQVSVSRAQHGAIDGGRALAKLSKAWKTGRGAQTGTAAVSRGTNSGTAAPNASGTGAAMRFCVEGGALMALAGAAVFGAW